MSKSLEAFVDAVMENAPDFERCVVVYRFGNGPEQRYLTWKHKYRDNDDSLRIPTQVRYPGSTYIRWESP